MGKRSKCEVGPYGYCIFFQNLIHLLRLCFYLGFLTPAASLLYVIDFDMLCSVFWFKDENINFE